MYRTKKMSEIETFDLQGGKTTPQKFIPHILRIE